jgi:hypothetical protein
MAKTVANEDPKEQCLVYAQNCKLKKEVWNCTFIADV